MTSRRLPPLPAFQTPAADAPASEVAPCALCSRPLGRAVEMHHLVPKSEGGRETVPLHPICHRKVHSLFTERELAVLYSDIGSLREHPDVASFLKWLGGKPADFHKRTARAARKRR